MTLGSSSAIRILISGVPATGKTSFGEWLRDNRGFALHDVDKVGWIAGSSGIVIPGLLTAPRLVVVWGFRPDPPHIDGSLAAVKELKTRLGFQCWFFDGDFAEAEARSRQRAESGDSLAVDQYRNWGWVADGLLQHRGQIEQEYEGRVVYRDSPPSDEVWEAILDRIFPAGLPT